MAVTNVSLGFKEKCSKDRTHLQARRGRHFFLAFEFVRGSPSYQDWIMALGSLDFASFAAIFGFFVLFCLLFLGFRVWRLGRRFEELEGILRVLQNVSADRPSGSGFDGLVSVFCGSKIKSWKGEIGVKDLLDESEEEEGDENDEEEEGSDGDGVMKLRKEIEKEKRLRAKAVRELEKERRAAASAAEEAMAKIIRLQIDKNVVVTEARQYREVAEQKKVYDQQYIEHLQWYIEKLELEKREMESRWAED